MYSYDAIIAENWENISAAIPFVSENKIVGRIYGTDSHTEKIERKIHYRYNPFYNRLRKSINSNKISGIIFNSTGSRSRDLYNLLAKGAKESKPVPVYLDMPNVLFPFPRRPKKRLEGGLLRLLQVGRMTDMHGFDLTVKIIERLIHKENIPVHAYFIGDGVKKNYLYNFAKKKGLIPHITFTGRLGLNCLRKYYEECDILINYYGYNPVIEALNHLTFVISREYGEIGEILKRTFSDNVYRICLSSINALKINSYQKKIYIDEVVKNIIFYRNNYKFINDNDFIPRKMITLESFSLYAYNKYILLMNN